MRTFKTNLIRSTFSAQMILIAILLLNISAAIAQSETKITADDAAEGDNFGRSVSISSDYAIVGAVEDDDDGAGSAYIFIRNGADWTQQAKLTADDAAVRDYFGCSVSISGDYAVIGANDDDDGGEVSGSAYIFVRNGADWTEQAKLTA
ncbi:MAG: FG-GAP repeat protein, partial [Calditrichaeota bacterium]|nr:FG-GAP repeat protein [Calditrichota bacterium]